MDLKILMSCRKLIFRKRVEGAIGRVPGKKLFGTVEGVFIPSNPFDNSGVIMYLREGWVVGNAGLLGARLIIPIAFGITLSHSTFHYHPSQQISE
ncbi:MAG: hypothetical protein R2741_06565 [Methanolobus sp.]